MSKGGIASLSHFRKDRIHYFDIQNSLFVIRFFRVSFSINLAVFLTSNPALLGDESAGAYQSGFRPEIRPIAHCTGLLFNFNIDTPGFSRRAFRQNNLQDAVLEGGFHFRGLDAAGK